MSAFLKEMGLESSDVVLKSDQENAIMDLLNIIANRRSAISKMEPNGTAASILQFSADRFQKDPHLEAQVQMASLSGLSKG